MAQERVAAAGDERVERGLARQLEALARRRAAGERRVGWKIAINSPAMQRHLDLPGPLLGFLTGASEHPAEEPLALAAGEGPHFVEVEVALSLRRDLEAGASPREAREAIGDLAPALEILRDDGSRDLETILANNVYHERALFGAPRPASLLADGDALALSLRVNDAPAAELDPALIVGEPAEIALFAAELLAPFGHGLRSGDRILCGSLNPPVAVRPGDRIRAELHPLGSLTLNLR